MPVGPAAAAVAILAHAPACGLCDARAAAPRAAHPEATLEFSEQRDISTPRGRFHVREAPGAGDALVLVHGWPESSYCWTHLLRHLPARWRVIAPDLRGLGDSERTPQASAYEKHLLAQDVLSVLDALGVDRFHLAGHDWGGVVAQEMALAAAARIRSLCLMNIAVINNRKGLLAAADAHRAMGNVRLFYQQFQRMPGGLFERLVEGREAQWLGFCLHRQPQGLQVPDDAFHEYVRMFSLPGTPGCGANYYRSLPADAQRWQQHAGTKYPMPALYVYGNRDPVIIPEYLQGIEDAFEQLELKQLDAGHFVQEEAPAEVAALLGEFLGRHG